jgi:protocatechuate 3,4-dioxygenase beta subunit
MRRVHLLVTLIASLVTGPAAQVSPARVAPPHVTVAVVDASDAPVADATVTLYGPMLRNGSLDMQTDDKGTVIFSELAPGGYRIGATKDGFVPVQEGQRDYRYAGRRFTLRAGEHRAVRLRLPRLGVVTGRVVDERGHPLVNATVRALEISMASGHRRLLIKAETSSDDEGVYRLQSLPPAGYLVCASAQLPARIETAAGYAPACHRSSAGARTTIAIGPGEERAAGDLRLADTRLARVEGTVAGLALGPDQDAVIQLLNQDDALGDVPEELRVTADGRFRFRHIPPGRYALVLAQRGRSSPSAMLWLAAVPVVVAHGDVTDVRLQVAKRATVRGEVVLHGGGPAGPGLLGRVEVRLEPARQSALTRHLQPHMVRPDAAGRFEIAAVAPGSYHLSATLRERPQTWFLDAVTFGGRDLLADTLDIKAGQAVTGAIATLTQQRGSLAGTLLDESGGPVPGAAVLVYPIDERYRGLSPQHIRYVVSSPFGDYTATGLRPGHYRVASLVGVELGAWYDPDVLREIDAAAVPVSIDAARQTILNLRVP